MHLPGPRRRKLRPQMFADIFSAHCIERIAQSNGECRRLRTQRGRIIRVGVGGFPQYDRESAIRDLHDLKARYIDLRQFVRFDRLMHGVLGIVGVCIWIDASTMPTPETFMGARRLPRIPSILPLVPE